MARPGDISALRSGLAGEPSIRVTPGGLDDPRVIELLHLHLATARAATAPGSAHALDLGSLRAPEISFWAAWDGDTLLGVGALRRIGADHGEVKSMHTAQSARRRGVGRAMLRHIIDAARATELSRLSLETGSWDYFAPARALYHAHGFVECEPFGEYEPDPNSIFMTCDLRASAAPSR
jgi:putative acetyltransferase